MRHLAPHQEPPALTAARPTLPPNWNDNSNQVKALKAAIRDRLYRHQYGLCGYCEGSLGELGRHIEHIEPKGGSNGNPARTWDYSNLLASCEGDKATGKSPDSCGHFKGNNFVKADFISPREIGCDQKFSYLLNGKVVPSAQSGTVDYSRSDYTIKTLGLDCLRLQGRRRRIAEKLLRQIDRLKGNPAVLQQLADHYLGTHPDSSGTNVLLSFYSTRFQRFFP